MSQTGIPDNRTLTAFGLTVLIGGMNFVAVRYSSHELAPLFGAGFRFAVAAFLLLGFTAIRRIPFPRGRALRATIVYGLLSFAVTYALAYWAIQSLNAGISAVVFGATPLITVVLAGLHRLEPITSRALIGGTIAVLGIVILADPLAASPPPVLRLLAVLGAAVGAAEASVIMKLVPPEHPVATNGVAMGLGALVLLALSVVTGEQWLLPTEGATWTALVYLILLGSVALFGLVLFTLKRWTATGSAYMTVLFPIVAMIGGAVLLDEAITPNGLIGGIVVIGAVYFGALSSPRSSVPSHRFAGVIDPQPEET